MVEHWTSNPDVGGSSPPIPCEGTEVGDAGGELPLIPAARERVARDEGRFAAIRGVRGACRLRIRLRGPLQSHPGARLRERAGGGRKKRS